MNPSESEPLSSQPSGLQVELGVRSRRSFKATWLAPLLAVLMVAAGAVVWLTAQGPQPAFGQLVASPPNFVFNTYTTLTFTIRIDTPTLNPTTVELQRVDATGTLIAGVGRMFDNGQGGDQKPGDRIFTAVVPMNEPQVGRLYFRVAAAFRGNKPNAHSAITFVDVDPFPLPPDPGEAGKQTLEGIDSDKDGVRDDVQREIALENLDSARARAALFQHARATQQFLLSSGDAAAAQAAFQTKRQANDCLEFIFDTQGNRGAWVTDHLLNTIDRIRSYANAENLLGPLTYSLSGDDTTLSLACDFDPNTLPN